MSTTATNPRIASDFFVLARDRGTVRNDLPVWASRSDNPFQLATATRSMEKDTTMTTCNNNNNNDDENAEDSNNKDSYSCPTLSLTAQRYDVDGVPGAFQILNILSKEETKSMVDIFEELGFTDDAAVSLPRKIRHNSNLVWISGDVTLDILWNRLDPFFVESAEYLGRRPMGLNGRFRVYRYEEGDFFKYHTDGSWSGTRISKTNNTSDGLDEHHYQLVHDAFPGEARSLYTVLFFLNDDFDGGETEFLVHPADPTQPATDVGTATKIGIRTPVGGVLLFPHGEHPLHCLHSSTAITRGIKYIIRSDVLFTL
ncbi:hypothetical protein IV203_038620 [Nitzschia inconspicua]|uniref:Fe2OG dioxygenase domain-containing protein n=1 Tax=Nitzschia inconspicua TaxID=303405 RepID=A0A9K3LRR2_9STRA|nr:hypothetical protein IV203_038620 [Nitzschia inconspicua]